MIISKGQFRGWDARIRDERLRHLRKLIEEHALTYVACVVPFDAFHKAIQTLPYKIKMTPHGAALLLLMGAAKNYRTEMGVNERVDFIFDDQVMEKTRLLEGWEEISAEIDPVERDFVSKTPIFRDDKDVMPLQAADMIAWLERNRWEQRFGVKAYEPPWTDSKDPVDGLTFIFDEESLAKIFQTAHDRAIAEIETL